MITIAIASGIDMMTPAQASILITSDDRDKELAALARLVTYARQIAEEIGAEQARYTLNIALGALLDELGNVEATAMAAQGNRIVFN